MRGAGEQLGHLRVVGRVLVLVGAGGPFCGGEIWGQIRAVCGWPKI